MEIMTEYLTFCKHFFRKPDFFTGKLGNKGELILRGLKYSIVLISEAIANTLQHIIAKKYHVSISGYTQCFEK
jgi:uncharacterized protein YutE (UPF0331/DUF86 family)